MRALVTGAGGFVGANLVRHLLAGGHEPVAMVRPDGSRWRLDDVAGDVAQTVVDLCDPEAIRGAVRRMRPEVIFHLAAFGAYSWQRELGPMLAVNVRASEELLHAASEVDATLVHAGSSSEYGFKDHPPAEDELVEPNSHYAVTKVAATHLCRLAAATAGTRASTLRLYSIYGPWEEPGRLMPTLVARCRAGGWPPLVGPGTARDFVWVGDACDAFVRAAAAGGEVSGGVFNIASGIQTTLADLVATAGQVFAVGQEPEWGSMEARTWDTATWVGDPARALHQLGWRATTTIADGLTALQTWMDDHADIAERYTS